MGIECYRPQRTVKKSIESVNEQITNFDHTTADMIHGMGFELLPLEECKQRSAELWDQKKQSCHGCGGRFLSYGMVYIFKDNFEDVRKVIAQLVAGKISFSTHNKKIKEIDARVDPDDGYYCSTKCYERHRSHGAH